MSYEVLARKYRPKSFKEVIGQKHVVQALINSIEQEKVHQAYIFSGTRGVGKTTIARILAKCLNCESSDKPTPNPCNKCSNTMEISVGRSVDFLEIDAASNTQVEKVRELIETVEYKPAKGRYKIYLIDEVHMLSKASFNALLKTLEEPPPHVIFLFATTNPENIPKTVQSRCLQLNLKTVTDELLIDHFKKILKNEKIKHDDESLIMIANSANGSVRDGLTLLDQAIAYGNGMLSKDDVGNLLGTIDNSLVLELIESVIEADAKKAFNILAKIEELSPEYDVILHNLISILHQISLEQALNNSSDEAIKNLAVKMDQEFCQLLYEICLNAFSKFDVHPSPKESLEICLLRMLTFNPLQKLSDSSVKNGSDIAQKKNLNTEKKEETVIKKENSFHLKNNNDWVRFFHSIELSPFARNYYGNMSFIDFNDNKLRLMSDSSAGEVPENIESEFKTVIASVINKDIEINYENGNVNESPIILENKKMEDNINNAQSDIKNDESINNFVKKFKGSIKKDSIKPLK